MQRVFVSGASSGIGEATVALLARRGFSVIAGVRDPADAEAAAWSAIGAVRPVVLDITRQETIASVRESIDGPLDGVVNNAGIGVPGPLEVLPIEDFRAQLEVNVVGQLALTQALLPSVRAARGRIVFVGSIGGKTAVHYAGAYNASKFALEGISDALRQELEEDGVAVTLIEPGVVDTPIWHKAAARVRALAGSLDDRKAQRYREPLHEFERQLEGAPERGIEPEVVAETIHEALTARQAQTRYPVGLGAKLLYRLRPLIPDRVYDALVTRAV